MGRAIGWGAGVMADWVKKIMRWLTGRKEVDYRDEIVDLVATCLINDRASWSTDSFCLTQTELKFSIWIANGCFSAGLNVDGGRAGPCNTCSHQNSFKMTDEQKRRLWDAIQGHSKQNRLDYAEQIICRVMAYYEGKRQLQSEGVSNG